TPQEMTSAYLSGRPTVTDSDVKYVVIDGARLPPGRDVGDDAVEKPGGHLRLWHLGPRFDFTGRVDEGHFVRVRSEPRAGLGHVVVHHQVDALLSGLLDGPVHRPGLGGEPDDVGAIFTRHDRRQDVRVGHQLHAVQAVFSGKLLLGR